MSRHPNPVPPLVLAIVTCSAPLLCAAQTASDQLVAAAARTSTEPGVPLSHLAFLVESPDGTQRIIARTVYNQSFPSFGVTAGDRFGNDVVVELSALWGVGGTHAVDLMVAAAPMPDVEYTIDDFGFLIPTPTRAWVLADDGRIGELRGIWGTGGVAGFDLGAWDPVDGESYPGVEWIDHDTGLDTAIYGQATSFAEGARGFASVPPELPAGELDPVLAVGTDRGFVQLVRFAVPTPCEWISDPSTTFDNPLISMAGPPVALPLPGVESVMLARVVEGLDTRFDFLAMAGGDFAHVDAGRTDPADPLSSSGASLAGFYADDVVMNDVDGEKLIYGPADQVVVPGGAGFLGAPIVTVDGSADVRVGVMRGDHVTYEGASTLTLSRPVSRLATGSLVAITTDGQEALFVPQFNPADPAASQGTDVVIGGVQTVDLGPETFQLRARGRFYTAKIEAAGTDVTDIVAASVSLTVGGLGGVPATVHPVRQSLDDEDGDGNQELVTKFDRAELGALLRLVFDQGDDRAGLVLTWDYVEECDFGVRCKGSVAKVIRLLD